MENSARESPVEIDVRVLKRIFNSLAEDKGLHQFFQYFLGFCDSNVVKDTQRILDGIGKSTLSSAWVLHFAIYVLTRALQALGMV